MEDFKLNIDFEIAIKHKLKLEEFFVLACLHENKERLIVEYTSNCGRIETGIFSKLHEKGFIIVDNIIDISFDSIKLTPLGNSLFDVIRNNNVEFNELFSELKNTYPSKVPTKTGGIRRLHGDLQRCIKLYKSTIIKNGIINLELHTKIIRCVKLYYLEKQKANDLPFLAAFATFLQQRNWEQYLDEANENIDLTVVTKTNFDTI